MFELLYNFDVSLLLQYNRDEKVNGAPKMQNNL